MAFHYLSLEMLLSLPLNPAELLLANTVVLPQLRRHSRRLIAMG